MSESDPLDGIPADLADLHRAAVAALRAAQGVDDALRRGAPEVLPYLTRNLARLPRLGWHFWRVASPRLTALRRVHSANVSLFRHLTRAHFSAAHVADGVLRDVIIGACDALSVRSGDIPDCGQMKDQDAASALERWLASAASFYSWPVVRTRYSAAVPAWNCDALLRGLEQELVALSDPRPAPSGQCGSASRHVAERASHATVLTGEAAKILGALLGQHPRTTLQ